MNRGACPIDSLASCHRTGLERVRADIVRVDRLEVRVEAPLRVLQCRRGLGQAGVRRRDLNVAVAAEERLSHQVVEQLPVDGRRSGAAASAVMALAPIDALLAWTD